MKTAKIFSVLSLALIFATASTLYSKDRITDNKIQGPKKGIRYEVTIHLSQLVSFCNTYLVKITDESGRAVAPPQVYVPGVSKYVFNETVVVPARVRIASLSLLANVDPYYCSYNLVTKSEPMMGPFKAGQAYSFNLFPMVVKGGGVEN